MLCSLKPRRRRGKKAQGVEPRAQKVGIERLDVNYTNLNSLSLHAQGMGAWLLRSMVAPRNHTATHLLFGTDGALHLCTQIEDNETQEDVCFNRSLA